MGRNREQTLEFKIEQAQAKVAKTRAAHEKAVDKRKKLYDIQKARQNEEILKAMETNRRSFDEIMGLLQGRKDPQMGMNDG